MPVQNFGHASFRATPFPPWLSQAELYGDRTESGMDGGLSGVETQSLIDVRAASVAVWARLYLLRGETISLCCGSDWRDLGVPEVRVRLLHKNSSMRDFEWRGGGDGDWKHNRKQGHAASAKTGRHRTRQQYLKKSVGGKNEEARRIQRGNNERERDGGVSVVLGERWRGRNLGFCLARPRAPLAAGPTWRSHSLIDTWQI